MTIVRGQRALVFPTRFMLVAATNPCPCGFAGVGDRCSCGEADLRRHRRRLSGPLLDRMDLLVSVERPAERELRADRRHRLGRGTSPGGRGPRAPEPATRRRPRGATARWTVGSCGATCASRRCRARARAGLRGRSAQRARPPPRASGGADDRRPERPRPRWPERRADRTQPAPARSRRTCAGGMSVRACPAACGEPGCSRVWPVISRSCAGASMPCWPRRRHADRGRRRSASGRDHPRLMGFDDRAARERCEAAGVETICRCRPDYPPRLRALDNPPAVLHVLGGLDRLLELAAGDPVAIVGARRASRYGLEVAFALGRGLGAASVGVVSGMALGVDSAAHAGALEGGRGTGSPDGRGGRSPCCQAPRAPVPARASGVCTGASAPAAWPCPNCPPAPTCGDGCSPRATA